MCGILSTLVEHDHSHPMESEDFDDRLTLPKVKNETLQQLFVYKKMVYNIVRFHMDGGLSDDGFRAILEQKLDEIRVERNEE